MTEFKYDPSTKRRIADAYPYLANYKHLGGRANDKIARFAIYMIDQASPVYEVVDFELRKKKSMELAGISDTPTKRKISDMDMVVAGCLTEYLSIVDNDLFTLWMSFKQGFYAKAKMSMSDIDSKDPIAAITKRQKLQESMREDLPEIQTLESQLFRSEGIGSAIKKYKGSNMVNYAEEFADPQDDTAI